MSSLDLRDELRSKDLLPHQVEFIEASLNAGPHGRVVLADDVGLGKTLAAAALVWALGIRLGHTPRTLVVCPAPLLRQWEAGLHDVGVSDARVVDASELRRLEARTDANSNPWAAVEVALVSVDFAKHDDRLPALTELPWDLVIVDEAHLTGRDNKRGRLVQALWGSDRVDLMVLASATPQAVEGQNLELPGSWSVQVLRRRAVELRDWDGRPILVSSDRRLEIVHIDFTIEERALFEAVRASVAHLSSNPRDLLQQQALVRVASSSLFALEQTLSRRLVHTGRGAMGRDAGLAAAFPDSLDTPNLEAETTSDGTPPEEIRGLLALLERVGVDSKWNACAQVLAAHLLVQGDRAVVFTDFADTARYLKGLLSEEGRRVDVLTGSTPSVERHRLVEMLRDEPGVLVLTSAASEGLSLSFLKLCIHYDVPWDPTELAQRLSRIHRLGAPPGVVRHFVLTDRLLVSDRLAEKMFAFEAAVGLDLPSFLSGEPAE